MAKKNILVFVSEIKSEQNYLLSYLPIIVKTANIYLVSEKIYTYPNYDSFYKKDLNLINKFNFTYIKTNLFLEIINSSSLKHCLKLIINFFFKLKFTDLYSNIHLIKKYFRKRNIVLDYLFVHESNLRENFLENFKNEKIYLFSHSLVMRGSLIEKRRRINIDKFIEKKEIKIRNYKNLFFIINFHDERLFLQKKYNQKLNILDFKSPLINDQKIKVKKNTSKSLLLVLGKLNYFNQSYKKEIIELIKLLLKLNFKIYVKFHPRYQIDFIQNKNLILVNDCVKEVLTKIDLAIVTSKTNTVLEIVSYGICVLEFYNSKKSTFENKKYEFKKNNNFVSISNYYGFVKNFYDKQLILNFLKRKNLNSLITQNRNTQINNLKNYLKKNYSKNTLKL